MQHKFILEWGSGEERGESGEVVKKGERVGENWGYTCDLRSLQKYVYSLTTYTPSLKVAAP